MPQRQIHFVEAIYHRTVARIRAAGGEGDWFEMTRGIRQGCSLSPIIFAVVVDVLLRRLDAAMGDAGIARAFADDTAVVLESFFSSFPTIAQMFDEYARISGLALNYDKTIIVPLWRKEERSYSDIDTFLQSLSENWQRVCVRSVAKYLGFHVGPGRSDDVWTKAIEKWRQRIDSWKDSGLGLQYHAMVYNVFCASVLYYIAQLEKIDGRIVEAEPAMMMKMAKGPAAWANASDLWRMGEQCGVGKSFHCIQARGQAAMLRTMHFENWERPIKDEVDALQQWRAETERHDRDLWWDSWYRRAFPLVLWENKVALACRGISLKDLRSKLCAGKDAEAARKKLHGTFQGEVAKVTVRSFLDVWEYRVDHKLERWKLIGNRHHYRNNLIRNLHNLGKVVAPRVAAAMWGLVWNRWCTSARRTQRESACLLGCGRGNDRIEHYIGCACARDAGRRFLRLTISDYDQRKRCMLGVGTYADDTEQLCWAVLAYGLYMTTNSRRFGTARSALDSHEVAVQEIIQHCRQASEGHAGTARCLKALWVR